MTRASSIGPGRALALAGLALLAACASAQSYDAARDIHDFLVAVRDGDRATFEAHIDRPALKASLKARLMAAAAGRYGIDSKQSVGAILAGPLVDVAADALLRPEVFRAAAELAGYGPETKIPPSLFLGRDLKPMGSDRVCAEIRRQCAFMFKNEDGVWKLIGFEGDFGLLQGRRDRL